MRYRTLDSVRGLAAVAVLLYHTVATFPGGGEQPGDMFAHGFRTPASWLYGTPLRVAVSGPAAVLLFFVLSGFVLTLSLNSGKRISYRAFVIARFARIWIPFAVAIVIAAVLSSFLAARPVTGVSPMFFNNWHEPLTLANVARHLAMTGSAIDLDGPMWSLIHELRISLIFPLLVLVTARFPVTSLVGSILMSFACILLLGPGGMSGHVTTLLQTATYIYLFVVGILLALNAEKVRSLLSRLGRNSLALLWVLALAGLTAAPADTSRIDTPGNGLLMIMSGVCAASIIALCIIGGRAESVLMARAPQFLGRISYSLYLTHAIVIVAIVHAVGGAWPLWVSFALALPVAIMVADLSQRFVEAPSQRLGKMLAKGSVQLALGVRKRSVRTQFATSQSQSVRYEGAASAGVVER